MLDSTTTAKKEDRMAISEARISDHLRVLCDEIGARPAASEAERSAAEYITAQLRAIGLKDIREQVFASRETLGYTVIPFSVLAAVSVPMAAQGRLGKFAGGAAMIAAMLGILRMEQGHDTPIDALSMTGESRNIIARIPAKGTPKRIAHVIAHMDSGKQRFTLPFVITPLTKAIYAGSTIMGVIGGLSLMWDALRGRRGLSGFQRLCGVMGLGLIATQMIDELQPTSTGANHNASGVAGALALAEHLAANPLDDTEVVLVFTGSAASIGIGIRAFLDQFAPPKAESLFVALNGIGAEKLAFAHKLGISYLAEYRPTPHLTALANRLAQQHPDLLVSGQSITMIDELAPIVSRGYQAISLCGYGSDGEPARWNRADDMIQQVNPAAVVRAATFADHLLRGVDW
jgi:hypothetical protein